HRELPLRASLAGRAARLHHHDLGVRAGLRAVRRTADRLRIHRQRHRRGRRPVRDLARAAACEATQARGGGAPQNALNVMIVRVSWMPGITWIFSFTKWPMSTPVST